MSNDPSVSANSVAGNDDSDASDEAVDNLQGQCQRFIIRRQSKLRLDLYLQRRLQGISRSKVQKLINTGAVLVNDTQVKPSTVVQQGDQIQVSLPPIAVRKIQAQPIPLDVIYEDDSLLVINKQANLIVHPARSHHDGTMLNGLAYRFQQQCEQANQAYVPRHTRGFRRSDRPASPAAKSLANSEPHSTTGDDEHVDELPGLSRVGLAEFRPGIVHRLDKNTTGLIVVAKQDHAHWALANQFAQRTTLKAYLAIVHGNFDTVGGVLEYPIGKHPTLAEPYAVRYDSSGKPSVTLFRVREQYDGYSLVELELKTGRTHQIRVHLSYVGHPIVGDILYGGEPIGLLELQTPPTPAGVRRYLNYARDKAEGLRVERAALGREDLILAHPALHAAFLRFDHPDTDQPITFTAPLHAPMARLVRELRTRLTDGPIAKRGYWVDLATALPQ